MTYEIPCNAWLASKSNDKQTMRDFQVASMISHKKPSDSNSMQICRVYSNNNHIRIFRKSKRKR